MLTLTIVEGNDKLLGYKTTDKLARGDVYRVSALWVTNLSGQILLAQRLPAEEHDAGCWGPAVVGTVEKGESYQANIYKEAEEELGIKNVAFRLGPKLFTPENGHGQAYWCQVFLAELDWPAGRFVLQPSEVAAVRWFDPGDLQAEVKKSPEKFVVNFAGGTDAILAFLKTGTLD
jgi:isopentenyldiphosphate isomerase